MDGRFNEEQFKIGVMREIDREITFGIDIGMPYTPTQNEEAKLGYDVRYTEIIPIFIQFKISRKLKYFSRNREYLRNFFNLPFYEFKIYPATKSDQHNILVDLAKNINNNVYYCAPGFTDLDTYVNHYQNKTISENSIFANVREMESIYGSDKHSVCFQIGSKPKSVMFSEPNILPDPLIGWRRMTGFIRERAEKVTVNDFIKQTKRIFTEYKQKEILKKEDELLAAKMTKDEWLLYRKGLDDILTMQVEDKDYINVFASYLQRKGIRLLFLKD